MDFFSSERQPKPGASDEFSLIDLPGAFPESYTCFTLIILWFNHEFFLAPSASYWYTSAFSLLTWTFSRAFIFLSLNYPKKSSVWPFFFRLCWSIVHVAEHFICVLSENRIAGIIWANLICTVISLIIISSSIESVPRFCFSISISQVKNILRLSLPFIPGALSYWLLNSANRWILLHYGTLAEVGLYSLAIKFTSFLIRSSYSLFWMRTTRVHWNNFQKEITPKTHLPLSRVIVFFWHHEFCCSDTRQIHDRSFFLRFTSIDSHNGHRHFPQCACPDNSLVAFIPEKVGQTFTSIVAGSIVSISASFLLVPHFGSIGAAYGTIIGNFVWFAFILIFYLRERNRMKLPLPELTNTAPLQEIFLRF